MTTILKPIFWATLFAMLTYGCGGDPNDTEMVGAITGAAGNGGVNQGGAAGVAAGNPSPGNQNGTDNDPPGGDTQGAGMGGSAPQGDMMGQGGNAGAQEPTTPDGQQCGIVLQSKPVQSGVVYTSAFDSPTLRWYRTDGMMPAYEGSMELTSGTVDMVLDGQNELLFVLHDITREAIWYRLNRPTSAAEPLFNRPQEAARVSFTNRPVAFAVDRIRNRLFTLTQPDLAGDGRPVTEMVMEITDLSNALSPIALGDPLTIPSATAVAVDAQRGLLFLYTNLTEELRAYDISGATPRLLEEMTVDLEATFPEPSQTAFNLKGFRVDEESGRLYAARDQVPNSQAVVFEYAPATSADPDGCVMLSPFTILTDPLDQSVPASDRTNLMGAAAVEPLAGKNGAFFVFAAWNGTGPQPMVTMLDDDLNFEPTCGEFATDSDLGFDMGCFFNGNAFDDRGVCLDSANQIGVVTVPMGVQFFPINADRSFGEPTEILEGGGIVAVCH